MRTEFMTARGCFWRRCLVPFVLALLLGAACDWDQSTPPRHSGGAPDDTTGANGRIWLPWLPGARWIYHFEQYGTGGAGTEYIRDELHAITGQAVFGGRAFALLSMVDGDTLSRFFLLQEGDSLLFVPAADTMRGEPGTLPARRHDSFPWLFADFSLLQDSTWVLFSESMPYDEYEVFYAVRNVGHREVHLPSGQAFSTHCVEYTRSMEMLAGEWGHDATTAFYFADSAGIVLEQGSGHSWIPGDSYFYQYSRTLLTTVWP